jgi:4-hydroxybenzoate polyprenyltransferase
MKNLRHPNFILSIISAIVLFIGIGLRANGNPDGDYVLAAGAALAGIHWIWAIIDVINRRPEDMKAYQKRFWLIVVITVPVFGAMVFYGLHQEKGKIIT